jgi:hypothetical protein
MTVLTEPAGPMSVTITPLHSDGTPCVLTFWYGLRAYRWIWQPGDNPEHLLVN